MTLNLRKYSEEHDIARAYGVYVSPDIDTWYQLKFDHDSGYLVIIHHDRTRPLVKGMKEPPYEYMPDENYYEMRRVVQRASRYSRNDEPSTIYRVLDEVLNNYKDLRDNRRMKDFEYERRYPKSKAARCNL